MKGRRDSGLPDLLSPHKGQLSIHSLSLSLCVIMVYLVCSFLGVGGREELDGTCSLLPPASQTCEHSPSLSVSETDYPSLSGGGGKSYTPLPPSQEDEQSVGDDRSSPPVAKDGHASPAHEEEHSSLHEKEHLLPSTAKEEQSSPLDADGDSLSSSLAPSSPPSSLLPSPSVVVAPLVATDPTYPMTPFIKRVWEVLRLLPPIDFLLSNIATNMEAGNVWQTERFYSGRMGYSMNLEATVDQIGPNGDEDSYLSVHLYLRRGDYDDELQWPFTGYMILQVLNWDEDHAHLEKHIKFDGKGVACARVMKGERAEEGVGLDQFVSLAHLKEGAEGAHYWDKEQDAIKLRVVEVIHP